MFLGRLEDDYFNYLGKVMKSFLVILLFFTSFIPSTLFAQKQEIVVWNYYLSPPFFISKDSGLAHDFVSFLNKEFKNEYIFKLRNLPRIRLNRELDSKKEGIVLFVNWKWMGKNSKKEYFWTQKILEDKNIVISHMNKQIVLKKESFSKALIFGGIRGRKYKILEEFFNKKQMKRYDVDSEEQVLNMIIKNRIDITTQPFSIATAVSKKMKIKDSLFFSPTPLFTFNRYIMLTSKFKELKPSLDQVIKKMELDINWQKTLQKYELQN